MKRTLQPSWGAGLILGLWLALLPAGPLRADPVGNVSHLSGTLSTRHGDGTRTLLALDSAVRNGDVLDTAANSYARIRFLDESEAILRPNSRVKVEQFHFVAEDPAADRSLIEVLKGGLRRVSGLLGRRSPDRDEVRTPVAVIGIRGTHYGLLLCQPRCGPGSDPSACANDCAGIPTADGVPLKDGLHIDVAAGRVSARNEAGEIIIEAGQFAYVRDPRFPPVLVPASQGVQVSAPMAIVRNKSQGQTLDITHCNGECVVQ